MTLPLDAARRVAALDLAAEVSHGTRADYLPSVAVSYVGGTLRLALRWLEGQPMELVEILAPWSDWCEALAGWPGCRPPHHRVTVLRTGDLGEVGAQLLRALAVGASEPG